MEDSSLKYLFIALIVLILMSAFFSGSETAMLALNRFRLRHLAKQRHRGALRATVLLHNPEKLIGIVLIGSTVINGLASTLATIIAIKLWGNDDRYIYAASLLVTFVLLIFAEMTPKTIGAMYPETIAFPSSLVLRWLLKVMYPLVWLLSRISNRLVALLGFKPKDQAQQQLSQEELRTIVDESGRQLPGQRQSMLLNVLDLGKVTVNDIMIPRNDVAGIDLDNDIDDIRRTLLNSQHTRLPVFTGDLNNVIGLLHMRNAVRWMQMENPTKAELMQLTLPPYFVPESTALPTQLINFQKNRRRMAMVVDEYGVVIGLVTLEDILEEIVGNFTTNLSEETPEIYPQEDGTYVLDGSTSVRALNRTLGWHLPTGGPKTLNGLLMEALENIPDSQIGIRLDGYCAEILQTTDNQIKSVRMWPAPRQEGHDLPELQANLFD
ncbi:MAG TPA: HlyC/CorC family transporter [Candidatus Acidoferrum sp.]|nr:HlyC/CorC family transporter [Candidatus Acidoferrum sp.]